MCSLHEMKARDMDELRGYLARFLYAEVPKVDSLLSRPNSHLNKYLCNNLYDKLLSIRCSEGQKFLYSLSNKVYICCVVVVLNFKSQIFFLLLEILNYFQIFLVYILDLVLVSGSHNRNQFIKS